jgi:hypothetical protein
MVADDNIQKIKIDDVEYALDNLSDNAKAQLANIQFVDSQLDQLNNEWAISDTARIGYTNALKNDLAKIETGKNTDGPKV